MAQIGALFYVGWAVLHINAAFLVYKLAGRQPAGMLRGRVYQAAWNLAFFAVAAAVVAILLNWFNSPLGFWLNLALTSLTDIGFILYILAPSYLPLWPGLLGPALWIAALLFSTLGILGLRP